MHIKIKKLKFEKDTMVSFCASWAFFQYLITLGFSYVLNRFGIRKSDMGSYIYYFIYILLFLFSLKEIITYKNLIRWLLICAVLMGNLLLGLIISPLSFKLDQSSFSMVRYILFYPSVILLYLNIRNYKKLFDYLIIMARILSVMCILIFYVNATRIGGAYVTYYDLVLGYQGILCSIILILSVIKKFNLIDLGLSLILAMASVFLGSRGALLVLLVFLAYIILNKFSKSPSRKKVIFIIVGITAIIVVSANYFNIMNTILKTLEDYNIKSRTLEYILNFQISNDSGRINIYKSVISGWEERPLFGYGLLGDRQFVLGKYAHNVILEFLTDYGFIAGGSLLIVFFVFLIKKIKSQPSSEIIILTAIFTFTSLMLSSSFVNYIHWYILIGMAYGYVSNNYVRNGLPVKLNSAIK